MFNKLFVSKKEYDKQIGKLYKEIYDLYQELNKIDKKLDYVEPNWYRYKTLEYDYHNYDKSFNYIPEPCKNCSNHPSNGGSGMCNCILGLPKVTC